MPSIPQPKNVSLLKILAYVFVFSGYVKYCSLHSAQDGFCALVHWAFQRPAGLYNHGWKCCECFLPHLILCLPVTCRTVQMKGGRPSTSFFPSFLMMVLLLDSLHGFS